MGRVLGVLFDLDGIERRGSARDLVVLRGQANTNIVSAGRGRRKVDGLRFPGRVSNATNASVFPVVIDDSIIPPAFEPFVLPAKLWVDNACPARSSDCF